MLINRLSRSVHNIRIERLWVDVTAQVGSTWAEHFTTLEMRHGLDINNSNHIWLLHYLFLHTINQQLEFFVASWNQHQIRSSHGPNRRPADYFLFDMHTQGIQGLRLPPENAEPLTQDEIEVFGIDWEGLRNDGLLRSREANNLQGEGADSWITRSGPPTNLNEVLVEAPTGLFNELELSHLENSLAQMAGAVTEREVITLWSSALALACLMHPELFQ